MASPQPENGHIDISNEIAEALCKINLSPYENRVLWFIFRRTYGWKKKTDQISYTQFEKGTGLNRWHIQRSIKKLIQKNVIIKIADGQKIKYGFQKDYEKWRPLPVEATVKSVTYRGYGALPIEATKPLPVEATTKEKKETIQKKETCFIPLSEQFNKIESSFSPDELIEKLPFLEYWTEKKPNGKKERWQMEKVFDIKRRYRTWLRNCRKWNKANIINQSHSVDGWNML